MKDIIHIRAETNNQRPTRQEIERAIAKAHREDGQARSWHLP